MGFYGDHILPRFIDKCCGMKQLGVYRKRACEGLHGNVIEIGFGSGLNVPFYPATVERVHGIEPAGLGWKLAEKRLAASNTPVERAGLDGQQLPFGDSTFDAALSTFTLCTIPDALAALTELRRVLEPGGTLRFVEHGSAPDESVRVWQRRLEPIQKRLAGGCHLTRDIAGMIRDAGFEITELDTFYEPGTSRPMAALSVGSAVKI